MEGITVVRDELFVLTIDVCTTTGCSNFSSWTIDFPDPTSSQAIVTKVVDWPDTALLLNGMVTLDAQRGLVLVADSFVGGVWLLDINEKTVELVIKDGSMVAPTGSSTPTGINGLRYRSGEIFFTNYAAGTLNRMPVDPVTGKQKGRSTVIASGLPLPDDFELDPETRYAYVAGGSANEILKIPIDGGPISIVASIPGPTSVRHGPRDTTGRDVLYAVGNGGLAAFLSGDPTLGGSAVRLGIEDE